MIFKLDYIYFITGILLLLVTYKTLRDPVHPRRISSALFWGLYALTFLFGGVIPPAVMGVIVISLTLIAGFGGVRLGQHIPVAPQELKQRAQQLGNRLFVPPLIIPALTLFGTLALKSASIGGVALLDPKNLTLVSMGIGCLVAFWFALRTTAAPAMQSVQATRGLLEAIGCAVILPQLLATLGGVFAAAGVGHAVSDIVTSVISVDNRFMVVVAYVLGMALFTMIMGNAFAAFPVMTVGVGMPFLVGHHGGNPAIMAAIGMYSGYCGTLLTPMAANFNVVPAALLELPDKNGVIKAQIPTALIVLSCNVFLMYFLMFKF